MITLLKDARLPFSVLLLAYALLLNVNLLLHPPEVSFAASAPLSNLLLVLLGKLAVVNSMALPLIFIALAWVQALLLNYIINSHRLMEVVTGLPGLFYLFIIALFNEHIYLSPPFFAAFGVLSALAIIYNSYNNDGFTLFYNAGFAIAIASLFYLPALLLIVFVFIGLTVTRIIRWRQWVVVVMGVVTPYILIGTWFFLTDRFIPFINNHFLHITTAVVTLNNPPSERVYKGGLMLAISLFSLLIAQQRLAFSIVKTKKMFNILTYFLFIAALTFAFTEQNTFAPIALLAIPVAVFLAVSFYGIRKPFFVELLNLAFIGLILYLQYYKYMP